MAPYDYQVYERTQTIQAQTGVGMNQSIPTSVRVAKCSIEQATLLPAETTVSLALQFLEKLQKQSEPSV
jgi:hypothetical protein